MRSKDGQWTPKELANSIVIDWVRAAATGRTGDLDKETPAFAKAVKQQLAKIHNRLLDRSGLDGICIDEENP